MLVLSARPFNEVSVFEFSNGKIYVYRDIDNKLKVGFCFPKDVHISRSTMSYENFDNILKKRNHNTDDKNNGERNRTGDLGFSKRKRIYSVQT